MRDAELLTFNFSVPAGAFERFGVAGNYVRILSTDPAGAVLTLETFNQGRDGSKVPIATGRDVDLGDFTEIRLTNETGQAVEVEMIAGFGRYRSQELLGSVSVNGDVRVDPVPDTFEQGKIYSNGIFQFSSTPGHAILQTLSNPAGSGVNLKVYGVTVSAGGDTEGPIYVYSSTNGLFPLDYSFDPDVVGSGTDSRPLSDRTVSADSKAEMHTDTKASAFLLTTNGMIAIGMSSKTPNNKTADLLNERAPVIIEPGYSLAVDFRDPTGSAALGMSTTFVWEEVDA